MSGIDVSNVGGGGGGDDVLVGYCNPDSLSALFHQALTQLLIVDRDASPRHIVDVISITSSPRIAATRNLIVKAFLAHPREPEWLLMLDADMTFPPSLIEDLLTVADPAQRPIVSGLYFGAKMHGGRVTPHAYVLNDDGFSFSPIEGVHERGQWGPVVRVHAVGAGCLLMHRSALLTVAAKFESTGIPWFVEGAAHGRDYGEDMGFCLRLLSCDIPVHVHTGVICGHVKPGIIDDASYLTYLADREVMGEEGVEARFVDRLRVAGVVKHQHEDASTAVNDRQLYVPSNKAVDRLELP